MHRTKIEYVLNQDGTPGYSWPILTGCEQPATVCATRPTCWARELHQRFKGLGKMNHGWAGLYNKDFSPKFNEHLLEAPFSLRKPSMIAVAFTGDMFGPGSENNRCAQERVLGRVRQLSQHIFIFLTKSPERVAQFNPWPDNAWVGASVTDKDSMWRAAVGLQRVEARRKWFSIEPLLSPLGEEIDLTQYYSEVNWLVIGAQSGAGAVKPKLAWVLDIIKAADSAYVKVWLKNNLLKLYPGLKKKQELP